LGFVRRFRVCWSSWGLVVRQRHDATWLVWASNRIRTAKRMATTKVGKTARRFHNVEYLYSAIPAADSHQNQKEYRGALSRETWLRHSGRKVAWPRPAPSGRSAERCFDGRPPWCAIIKPFCFRVRRRGERTKGETRRTHELHLLFLLSSFPPMIMKEPRSRRPAPSFRFHFRFLGFMFFSCCHHESRNSTLLSTRRNNSSVS
jgi:hypothetical protein